MNTLNPWAQGPFELILHAEEHFLKGDDFDRRMALISFDNAIEVAIATFLSLHPIQRGGRQYQKIDVTKWRENYHSMLDFLEQELVTRGKSWEIDRPSIVWCHECRNEQYHGGSKGTPEKQVLEIARKAALWIFSVLYDVADIEKILSDTIQGSALPAPFEANTEFDRAIDDHYGMVKVGNQTYYTSEVLLSIDEEAYKEIGASLTLKIPGQEAEA